MNIFGLVITTKERETKRLVSFGKYLLSRDRYRKMKTTASDPENRHLKERVREVHHADIENWKNNVGL
jgi:hypothetical protein